MRILAVAPDFPHQNHPYSGIFSQRIVSTLSEMGHDVEVLCPKPFVPPGVGRIGRWRQYDSIPNRYEIGEVLVTRPSIPIVPGVLNAFWADTSAWLVLRWKVLSRHRADPFDAVLGFDLGGSGGLAWRLAGDLRVPSAGWAFGSEVRSVPESGEGRSVARAIRHLDLVFYQSSELRQCAGQLVGKDLSLAPSSETHVVLPHGIRVDAPLPTGSRTDTFGALSIAADREILLFVGRIIRDKGVFELVDAFGGLCQTNSNAVLVLVGAIPHRDASAELQAVVTARGLDDRIRIVPSMRPDQIPGLLSAADLFVFTSHLEGMPNAVLEAMHAGTPTIAYDIPPLREADPTGNALKFVPRSDVEALRLAIESLLSNKFERAERSSAGRRIAERKFDMRRNLAIAVEHLAQARLRRLTSD